MPNSKMADGAASALEEAQKLELSLDEVHHDSVCACLPIVRYTHDHIMHVLRLVILNYVTDLVGTLLSLTFWFLRSAAIVRLWAFSKSFAAGRVKPTCLI